MIGIVVAPPLTLRQVTYYDPFKHYVLLDSIRAVYVGLAVFGLVWSGMLAVRRWNEGRRSATYFLVAIQIGLIEDGYGSILGLGHPFTYVTPIRGLFLVFVLVACAQVVREYAQPGRMWDPGK